MFTGGDYKVEIIGNEYSDILTKYLKTRESEKYRYATQNHELYNWLHLFSLAYN